MKIYKYKGDELYFGYSKYAYGDGMAIIAFTTDDEPYATVSVNLPNFPPPCENEIDIPLYNLKDFYDEVFKEAFVEKQVALLPIGMGEGIRVKLRDDFKQDMVNMLY